MKKIACTVLMGIFMATFFSCTPEQLLETTSEAQACCDETGQIHPPPPPPIAEETGE